jgi:hypothetical protein
MCKLRVYAIFKTLVVMHIFRGSFSYISEFKIIYEALIVLSSITKKGEIESVSRPPSGFWCLNDKIIKELMTFAKCETGKMSYKLH